VKLSRRHVLRSAAGLAVTLPFLPSLARAATPPPRRFIGLYSPNGVNTKYWFPTKGGSGLDTDFTLNRTHAALQPWKSNVLWFGGLDMKVALQGQGEQHQRGLGGLMTGRKILAGQFVGNDGTTAGWASGASIDQLLVPVLGMGSRLASLQLGVKASERDVSGVLSYAGASQPLLPQNDPVLVFDRLFTTSGGPVDEMERLRRRRASVLDGVREQLGTLRSRLSTADRGVLDAHLTQVRDLETRLTATSTTVGTCNAPLRPTQMEVDSPARMGDVSKVQLELLSLALSCDLTRCATVMYSDAKNHTTLPFLNVYQDVHNVSHMGDDDPAREALYTRDAWQVDQLVTLMQKLSSSPEGDGTVLDHTTIFWGSDVSRGNTHAHDDMPFLVAGGGTGWKGGRYLRFNGRPHNDLLLSMFTALGGSATSFGDAEFCTGALSGL